MRVELDPHLVEEATFRALHAWGDPVALSRLRSALEDAYSREPGPARESAFREIHARFFRSLGLDRELERLMALIPHLDRAERIVFALVDRRGEERADLLVSRGGRGGRPTVGEVCVGVRSERFADLAGLRLWLRRELMHVSDMLDPEFGYLPDLGEPDPARDNLLRDRYRVLWSAWIEARLAREGHVGVGEVLRHQCGLERAFRCGEERSRWFLESLPGIPRLDHRRLVAWAREGLEESVIAHPAST